MGCKLKVPIPGPVPSTPPNTHSSLTSAMLNTQVTLPLMVLDLYDMADNATGGAPHSPIQSKWLASALMPLMIFLGAVHRFWANELRPTKDYEYSPWQLPLGILGWGGSIVIFAYVVVSIVDPIVNETCPPAITTNCSITDPNLKNDATAVQILTLAWIGYPAVSVIVLCSLCCVGNKTDERVTFFKDVAYAALDVVSKAGLALYVAYRHTWLTG